MAYALPSMDSNIHSEPRIVIIGGGLAGISAALSLADAGRRVLVLERNRFLGGRAASNFDRHSGSELDLGQHVYLQCCTYYTALLRRLGVDSSAPLHTPLAVPVIDAAQHPAPRSITWLRATSLPAGLHMAPAFLAYRHLSWSERLRTARNIRKFDRLDRSVPKFKQITFGTLLRQHGESERAIDVFWNLFLIAALNSAADDVAAHWGLMLLQEALLAGRHSAEIGVPQIPLSHLLAPATSVVEQAGGQIVLGQSIRSLHTEGHRATGVSLQNGAFIPASAVIIAVNHHDLPRILPPRLAELPYFAELTNMPSNPIIDVHLGFSEPNVLPPWPFATFLNSPVRWLFVHDHGRRLSVSISRPDPDLAARSAHDIRQTITAELQRIFGIGQPDWVTVRRHRHATFSLAPGMDAYRRPQRTPIPGLYVAGDWTDTGWPSTMESAVRSGELAAKAVLHDLHDVDIESSAPPSPTASGTR